MGKSNTAEARIKIPVKEREDAVKNTVSRTYTVQREIHWIRLRNIMEAVLIKFVKKIK